MDDSNRRVAGHCPYGCGETLFLGAGGYVTCSYLECPRPDAVSTLLDDRETQHLVDLGDDTFTIRHPLRERLDDALLGCDLDEYLRGFDGPPLRQGRYRAMRAGHRWAWNKIGSPKERPPMPEPMTPRQAAVAAARETHEAAHAVSRQRFYDAYIAEVNARRQADDAYEQALADIERDYPQGGEPTMSLPHLATTCDEHHALVRDFDGPRPTITVLCGSTRFGDAFRRANLELTLAGHIVLSPSFSTRFEKLGDALGWTPEQSEQIKAGLDAPHKRKIDLADEVLVLDVEVDGVPYIGESTRSEISYAKQLGRPVRYLSQEAVNAGR